MKPNLFGNSWSRVCLIFYSLVYLTSGAGAYYVDFNGTITPYAYTSPSAPLQYTLQIVLLKLGVDAGGTIGIDVTLKPKDTVAIAVVYSYVQIVDVLQSTSFKHPNYPSYGRVEIAGDSSVTFKVPVRNRYYLVIYTPSNVGELSYEGRATILNPYPFAQAKDASGNNIMTHLAVEDYYMPVSAYVSTSLFAVLAALWFWRFRSSRFRRYPIQHLYLPKLITLTILARLTSAALAFIYYFQYETTGWADHDIAFAQSLAEVAANSLFLGLLILTAMGYTVSRVFLTVRERQLLTVAFLTLVVFAALLARCPKTSNDDLCISLFLGVQAGENQRLSGLTNDRQRQGYVPTLVLAPLLTGLRFRMLVVKFLITFSVILQLHSQIDTVRDACQVQHATTKAGLVLVLAGYRKLQLLEIFRWIILFYLALPVAFLFGSFSLVSWVDEGWLPTLAENICTWAVLLSLGWVMSPGRHCILDGAPVPPSPSEADVLDAQHVSTPAAVLAPRLSVATSAEPLSETPRSNTAMLRTGVNSEEEQEVELSGYRTPRTVEESGEEEEENSGTEEGKLKKIRSSPSLKGGSS